MLRLRTYANVENVNGTIFGGWIMQQANLAGKIAIKEDLKKDSKLIKISNFIFHSPLFLADILEIYAEIKDFEKTLVEIKAYKDKTLIASTIAQYKLL